MRPFARTHYDTLGVSPSASTEEIHAAYHERARLLHPDVAESIGRPGVEDEMRAVNEAWRVLGDSEARVGYDQELRRAAPVPDVISAAPDGSISDDEPDDMPLLTTDSFVVAAVIRGWPVLVVALVVAIFVYSAYATGNDGSSPPADRTESRFGWETGDCLDRLPTPTPVPCGDTHDAVVVAIADDGERCVAAGSFEADVPGPDQLCIVYDR